MCIGNVILILSKFVAKRTSCIIFLKYRITMDISRMSSDTIPEKLDNFLTYFAMFKPNKVVAAEMSLF